MQVGQKIGPFVIEKEIGAGAMGAVYRARNPDTGQRVAIKVVSPNLMTSDTAMARFKRESAILKQLRHPNIVKLVATGKLHGAPFYAMEYVEGESLDRVMARRDRITWEHMVTLGKQLCDALQHAHDKGIVHRDLKPSNLMVLPDDTVKLTDFGIAKDLDVTALTEANCTVGTAAYMSPEQCKGERDLTHKSDLYSMGIMFFELLTGKKPLIADNPMDMFMKHVNTKPPRVSQFVDVPSWLDTLIDQLMSKKPEHRPLNAAKVGEALMQVQEKVEARQSAALDKAKKRVIDRLPDEPKISKEDRETLRILMGKKKRKNVMPFYRQNWFAAVCVVVLLLFVGFLFYQVFLRRPSPDELYAQAKTLMTTSDPTKWKEAYSGPIKDFLTYYGDLDDDQAKTMRRWDTLALEAELLSRARESKTTFDKDEEQFRQALDEEDKGKLREARSEWDKLTKYKDEKDRDKRSFAWLAQERLKRLEEVNSLEKKLAGKIQKDWDTREKDAALALFWEQSKEKEDQANARKKWQELKPKESELDDVKKRPWYLLAQKHLLQLGDQPTQKKTSRRPEGVLDWQWAALSVYLQPHVEPWRRHLCIPHPTVTAAVRRSPVPAI